MLWWQYHFPTHGDARAAARRKGNPVMEVLYSRGFAAPAAIVIWVWCRYSPSTAEPSPFTTAPDEGATEIQRPRSGPRSSHP